LATSEKGLFCSEHCTCLEIVLSERDFKELREKIDKWHKSESQHFKELNIPIRVRIGGGPYEEKVRTKLLILEVSSTRTEGSSEDNFYKVFRLAQKSYEFLEVYDIKKFDCTACTAFVFDSEKFRPVGELMLPTKVTLRPDLIKRLGETELSGVTMDFKKSPLGIDAVTISLEDAKLRLRLVISYSLDTIKDFLDRTFNHAKEVARLFVEEK